MKQTLSIIAVAAAALAAAPNASAQSRRGVRVEVDVNRGHSGRRHTTTVQQKVWVPGGHVYENRTVTVPGYYKTVMKEVRTPSRTVERQERVWVPGQWVSTGRRHRTRVGVQLGPVQLEVKGKRRSGQRFVPGHWETRTKLVTIPGRCERRPVKVWVPACTRTERVKVFRKGHWEMRTVRAPRRSARRQVVVETHRERSTRRGSRREVRREREVRPVRTYRPSRNRGRVTLEFGN